MWITAYYTVWGVCDLPPGQIDWSAISHIVHQQLEPTRTGRLWQFPRAFHDDDTLYFERGLGAGCGDINVQEELIRLAHLHKKKVILGLGGAGAGADAFRYITSDNTRMMSYVSSVLAYAESRGYDGVDIDWEFVLTEDEERFSRLLRIMRQRLDAWSPKGILTVAIPGWRSEEYGYNAHAMNTTVDQINLMTYDLSNQWSRFTGHNAPAYLPRKKSYDGLSTHGGVEAWISAGVERSKIGLGLPFFGYYWDENDAPGQSKRGKNIKQISYRDVFSTYASATRHWDEEARVPWLSGKDQHGTPYFVSYENETSLTYKVNYAKAARLGGIMIFELWRGILPDEPRQPLLRAVRDAAWASPSSPPPSLLTPTKAARGVTFRWKPLDTLASFRVQIHKDRSFTSSLLVDTLVQGNRLTVRSLPKSGTLFWRIREEDELRKGTWSKPKSFSYKAIRWN